MLKNYNLKVAYFSPTNGTRVVTELLADKFEVEYEKIDLTDSNLF